MAGAASTSDLRRRLPSVDELLRREDVAALGALHGRGALREELRRQLGGLRERAASGDEAALEHALSRLPEVLAEALARAAAPSLEPVINATGVVIHTNLGRAPLSAEAAARVALVASSYSNLELDLASGERGDRETHAEGRLRRLLGTPASLVVNNNAAAVLLAVNTLAEGREVVVSRGELVEIGGSFRIPDVVRKGGARLREVGTTNRTRLSDYASALGPETALVLKAHPSNFRIVGFTEAPPLRDLAALAHGAGLPLVEDLGSGLITRVPGLEGEPSVAGSLGAGADVVTMSGDKLLGGPQAGLLAGRADLLGAMRTNPLYRALRVDKMTVAALEAVLAEHESERAARTVPVLRMLAESPPAIRARAEALATTLGAGVAAGTAVVEGSSAVGGGAAPGVEVPTVLLALRHPRLTPDAFAAALRGERPPVVARIAGDRLVLDLRTVRPEDDAILAAALGRVLRA